MSLRSFSSSPEKPGSFTLSVSNTVFLVLAVLLTFGIHFLPSLGLSNADEMAESIGYAAGSAIGLLIWPGLLSWFLWRMTGRRRLVGSLTFNLLLALSLLATIGRALDQRASKDREKAKLTNQVREQQDVLRKSIEDGASPEESARLAEQNMESLNRSLSKMQEIGSGYEKEFFRHLEALNRENQQMTKVWSEAVDAVDTDRILDPARLQTGSEEFQFQRKRIQDFIASTELYRIRLSQMPDRLRQKVGEEKAGHPLVRSALKGMEQSRSKGESLLKVLQHEAHYGRSLLAMLDYLEQHRSEWSLRDGQLVFLTDASLAEFQSLGDSLSRDETLRRELAVAARNAHRRSQ